MSDQNCDHAKLVTTAQAHAWEGVEGFMLVAYTKCESCGRSFDVARDVPAGRLEEVNAARRAALDTAFALPIAMPVPTPCPVPLPKSLESPSLDEARWAALEAAHATPLVDPRCPFLPLDLTV